MASKPAIAKPAPAASAVTAAPAPGPKAAAAPAAPAANIADIADIADPLAPTDTFVRRHLGPSEADVAQMLGVLGLSSLAQLVDETVPAAIRIARPLDLPDLPDRPLGERELLTWMRDVAKKNRVVRSFLGMGYSDCIVPGVIQRNILENPGWYTQYTPYQSEISQGRLEALLNFQTLIGDLTGLPVANASLLDEGTAAAEAVHLCAAVNGKSGKTAFFVADDCHPQTIAVVCTRAEPLGIDVVVTDLHTAPPDDCFGVLVQNPGSSGVIRDVTALTEAAHDKGAVVTVATDLLALTLMRSPGEMGADIAVGSAQRFGVPLGFGGPHAGFMSVRSGLERQLPGRLV
ncbi:MAG TPA: glycine dehydrogenase (aminomethyl-transferring), partial [Thermoanaerobaculia bacterium]|nr:glycine dehydrogenase (aminomethyl-transferring) [Thermoanaerobaculia bacterium]